MSISTNVPGLPRAGSVVKTLPVDAGSAETWAQFMSWEDPPEKEIATHSSILAWEIPWTEEPGRLQSMGSQRVGHHLATKPPANTVRILSKSRYII